MNVGPAFEQAPALEYVTGSPELLETDKGERLVRFSYSTGGVGRRGPVTLRERDLERLRAALVQHPELAEAIAMS